MGICVQEISDNDGPYSYSAVVVMSKMLIHIHLMSYKKELSNSCHLAVCEITVEINVAMVAINLVTKH